MSPLPQLLANHPELRSHSGLRGVTVQQELSSLRPPTDVREAEKYGQQQCAVEHGERLGGLLNFTIGAWMKAGVEVLAKGMVPAAAGRSQPGSVEPGAAADHPRPTGAVTWMTRVDRPLDLGVADGPGIQAPLPDVAGQVVPPERAHPAGRVTDNGGASRIVRQVERGPRRIGPLVAPWMAAPI